jgi:hypothetical protein
LQVTAATAKEIQVRNGKHGNDGINGNNGSTSPGKVQSSRISLKNHGLRLIFSSLIIGIQGSWLSPKPTA